MLAVVRYLVADVVGILASEGLFPLRPLLDAYFGEECGRDVGSPILLRDVVRLRPWACRWVSVLLLGEVPPLLALPLLFSLWP